MNSVAKKVAIYSLIGIMQIGFGAAVIEAAPRERKQRNEWRYEDREHKRDRERERERKYDERIRKEYERHEREMRRRPYESKKEWQERQWPEKNAMTANYAKFGNSVTVSRSTMSESVRKMAATSGK